jgi:hypothetical protein
VEVEKPGRDGLLELAAEADVVFYSKTWAEVGKISRDTANRTELSVLVCSGERPRAQSRG